MTASVVDYDTGELMLAGNDQTWAITLQAFFSVEYTLTDGTFAWGTSWMNLNTWGYGQLNPCEIDISSYETGFGVEDFLAAYMYIPDGYFLPEDYLEMNYKESDTEHTDFPFEITIKLKKHNVRYRICQKAGLPARMINLLPYLRKSFHRCLSA